MCVQKEIGSVIEEGNLKVKLEELDKLEELAKGISEPAWSENILKENSI